MNLSSQLVEAPDLSRGSGPFKRRDTCSHVLNGGRTSRSDIKPHHPLRHSERSDPAFSCARPFALAFKNFLRRAPACPDVGGVRAERARRPIASRHMRAMNLSSLFRGSEL